MARTPTTSQPVAFVFGLPLYINEALAFMAWEAGAATSEQLDTLLAWKVAMILSHGSWVDEELGSLKLSS